LAEENQAPARASDGDLSSRRDPERRGRTDGTIVGHEAGILPRAAARSDPADDAKKPRFIDPGMTGDRAAARRRRDDVVRNLLEPHRDSRDLWFSMPSWGDARTHPDLPHATRFAAPLSDTTAAADGETPLVEKNTERDVDGKIYFPPDAQLAYANRAGVQGDLGTVALWVEPVDWAGRDARVRSFFRVNDPNGGDYRFHLLKDADHLRFQFITEHGESNLRVPIDWWPRGEAHHVAVTWGNSMLRLYVDGVALSEQPYEGTLMVASSAPGWWGSNNEAGTQGAGAILGDALVVGRPLGDAEMLRLWEEKPGEHEETDPP
jgi:hypothetical protein